MSLYLSKVTPLEKQDGGIIKYYSDLIFNSTLPIVLTFGLIVYIIILNFIYFKRINSNRVSDSYHTYSFVSSLLLIIQIGIIVKYMFHLLHNNNTAQQEKNKDFNALKSISYLLIVINVIFVMISNILLAFYSTDG